MATFDAVFVGLTILDIAGRPVVAIRRARVAFIEQIRLNPAGTAAGANINAAKLGIAPQRWPARAKMKGRLYPRQLCPAGHRLLAYPAHRAEGDLGDDPADSPQRRTSGPALPGASDALFVSEAEFDAVLDCRFLHHGGTGLLAAMDRGTERAAVAGGQSARSHHQL